MGISISTNDLDYVNDMGLSRYPATINKKNGNIDVLKHEMWG